MSSENTSHIIQPIEYNPFNVEGDIEIEESELNMEMPEPPKKLMNGLENDEVEIMFKIKPRNPLSFRFNNYTRLWIFIRDKKTNRIQKFDEKRVKKEFAKDGTIIYTFDKKRLILPETNKYVLSYHGHKLKECIVSDNFRNTIEYTIYQESMNFI